MSEGVCYTFEAAIEKAIEMEENCTKAKAVVGLGRRFKWADVMKQGDMFANEFGMDIPCDCYDGE